MKSIACFSQLGNDFTVKNREILNAIVQTWMSFASALQFPLRVLYLARGGNMLREPDKLRNGLDGPVQILKAED